ncbi:MAG: hypothetical protein QOG23_4668 [Blastocatellia bacterium]|jgi:hypothetical protein|nr:hypothetical protein [Blastocatellia bacterium]
MSAAIQATTPDLRTLVKELLEDLSQFSLARPRLDDLTVMAIEMVGH